MLTCCCDCGLYCNCKMRPYKHLFQTNLVRNQNNVTIHHYIHETSTSSVKRKTCLSLSYYQRYSIHLGRQKISTDVNLTQHYKAGRMLINPQYCMHKSYQFRKNCEAPFLRNLISANVLILVIIITRSR